MVVAMLLLKPDGPFLAFAAVVLVLVGMVAGAWAGVWLEGRPRQDAGSSALLFDGKRAVGLDGRPRRGAFRRRAVDQVAEVIEACATGGLS